MTNQMEKPPMPAISYTFVEMYSHALDGAAHLLTKGAEYAKTKGVAEKDMLGWRLIEDMHPLGFQIMVVCNFSRQFPARVAGLEVPQSVSADLDVAGFQAAIADAKAYLAALTPEQFEGRDDLPLTVPIGDGSMKPTLPGVRWLSNFCTTNLYFHLSTAYDILRANGAPSARRTCFQAGFKGLR
jgi:hypothetical protein